MRRKINKAKSGLGKPKTGGFSESMVSHQNPAVSSTPSITIKTFAVLALLLLGVTTGLFVFDNNHRQIREDAYQKIAEGVKQDNDELVLKEISRFLSATPLGGTDNRELHVFELRKQARMVPNRRIRDNAYAKIQDAVKIHDYFSVLLEAENFLSPKLNPLVDKRRDKVLSLYSEAFVKWFVGLSEEISDHEQKRIKQYKLLARV